MDCTIKYSSKMKRKSLINRTQFAIILMFFTIMPLCAQEEFDPVTDDLTPPASIDGSIPLLLIAAVVLGYVFLNRKLKNNKF